MMMGMPLSVNGSVAYTPSVRGVKIIKNLMIRDNQKVARPMYNNMITHLIAIHTIRNIRYFSPFFLHETSTNAIY